MIPTYTHRHKLITSELLNKFNSVKNIHQKIKNENEHYTLRNFYDEVSYYVHYIYETEEFNKIFKDLLQYSEKLKKNQNYIKISKDIKAKFKTIADKLLKNDTIKLLINSKDGKEKDRTTLGLLKNISSVLLSKTKIWSFEQIADTMKFLFITIARLSTFVESTERDEIKKITDELFFLEEEIDRLQFFDDFKLNYNAVNSASSIDLIYTALNPMKRIKITDSEIVGGAYRRGEPCEPIDKILQNCEKVYHNLTFALSMTLSKNLVINKFISYIELYGYKDIPKSGNKMEKHFQKEFEQFLFLHGYYPISEMDIGNGRLDTLSIDEEAIVLYEFKQIGLGKTKEKQKDITKKIYQGIVQSSIYIRRLQAFPNILPEVHIVIASNKFLQLSDNNIFKNNVVFYFYCINLSNEKPSKQRQIEIDINNLFKD